MKTPRKSLDAEWPVKKKGRKRKLSDGRLHPLKWPKVRAQHVVNLFKHNPTISVMNTPECSTHYLTSIRTHNSQRTEHKNICLPRLIRVSQNNRYFFHVIKSKKGFIYDSRDIHCLKRTSCSTGVKFRKSSKSSSPGQTWIFKCDN